MPRKKWNRELVVAFIQDIHRSGGKLNSNYAQQYRRALYLAACVYCGGWRQAVKAAGIPYDQVKILKRSCPKWSKDKIINEIRKLHRSGQPINSNYVQLQNRKTQQLYHSAVKYFGGWKQGLEAAGFDYSRVRLRTFRSWSKKAIARSIQDRLNRGLSLNSMKVIEEDYGLYLATKRHIGSWKKALRVAGVNPSSISDPRITWTKERVRREILALYGRGLPLNMASIKKTGCVSLCSAACKLFGSWRKAIRSAGLCYAEIKKIRIRWWTSKRVVWMIRRLERAGVRLGSKAVQQSRGGLFGAAILHFGSWSQAVEAAGYDYALHSRVWSSKAFVRKLTAGNLKEIDRQSLKMSKIRGRS